MVDSANPLGSGGWCDALQVTSLWSDSPRLLLCVASPMPLSEFSLYVGNFLVVTTDVRLYLGGYLVTQSVIP